MSEERVNDGADNDETLPDWSQFSRRLASFGLGEIPDPLLTRMPSSPKPDVNQRHNTDPMALS